MGLYEERIKNKSAESILETAAGGAGSGAWTADDGEILRLAARIRVTQDLIMSQHASTRQLADSIQTLVASLNRAPVDTRRLGRRIVFLTFVVIAVGTGQIVATAWPYLSWWYQHRS